jgi:HAD superfamily hydrolase (TIGR01509 family)
MIQEAISQYLQRQGQANLSPKAVLFDMDGVLYDSMPFHARAWHETAIRHNLLATPEDFYLFEGRTGDSTIDELFYRTFRHEAMPEEKDVIYQEKAALFNKYNDGRVMKGAPEVLEQVRAYGLETLIVTGSGQHSLIDKLNHTFPGVFERDKMITAFDVAYGKPHPEPYLMGLEKAGVTPREAIVIENAPMGIRAAVAAGIFTIAVNTGPLKDDILWNEGANLLYPDMDSLAADWGNIMAACQYT